MPVPDPALLRGDEVARLTPAAIARLYRQYVNPGLVRPTRLLGLTGLDIIHARGNYLHTRDGRKILDCGGGMGVLTVGHNHPRLIAARRALESRESLEYSKALLSPWLAALAHNLVRVAPGDLQRVFFCNSGAEAVEGALKTAERMHPERSLILHSDLSFHGKTHAALAVSALDPSRTRYKTLTGCLPVPFNDQAALAQVLQQRHPQVVAVLLEAVAGTRVIPARPGYLRAARALCTRYDIPLIIDEVLTGFGRTGRLFACEHDGVVPDLLCFAKGLSGGKVSLGGVLLRESIFSRSWGLPGAAFEHTTTFSGLASECATALETLAVIIDEDLTGNAAASGAYFLDQLRDLQRRFPRHIHDVRGQGLFLALELSPELGGAAPWLQPPAAISGYSPQELYAGLLFSRLVHRHGILPAVSQQRRDLIVFCPPLAITPDEIDIIVTALEQCFTTALPVLSTAALRCWFNG